MEHFVGEVFLLLSERGRIRQKFRSQVTRIQTSPTSALALRDLGCLIFQEDQYVLCVCMCLKFCFSTQHSPPPGVICSVLWGMIGPGIGVSTHLLRVGRRGIT